MLQYHIVDFLNNRRKVATRRMAIANGTLVSFCNHQPKAHFGLPWDNCGTCHIDEKRIQSLSNASQHVPIYLQPFPSNSSRTIAVSITRLERGFNSVKCLVVYIHLSSTVSEI